MRASLGNFLPDEALAFRSIGSDPVTETFESPAIDLSKLEAYWSTDEWGIADKLLVAVNIYDVFFGDPVAYEAEEPDLVLETYTLSLEVAADEEFGSPTTVCAVDIDENAMGGYVVLAVDPEDMREFDATAKFIRLVATMAGEAPSLSFSAYIKK